MLLECLRCTDPARPSSNYCQQCWDTMGSVKSTHRTGVIARFWRWVDTFFIGSSGIGVVDEGSYPRSTRKIGEL